MKIRDRIRELRRVPASELRPNSRNWRVHPQHQQDALRGVLAEIGYADALIARELDDGTLELLDGHLRASTTPDAEVPVLVVDLDDAEAAKILATLDPLASLATADKDKLDLLLREVQTASQPVAAMLTQLAEDHGVVWGLNGDGGAAGEDVPAPVDRAAELQEQWRTERGQLWEIPSKSVPGRCHRVLCGDSTDADGVARVMCGEKAGLMNTDPPYGVKLNLRANHEASNAAKGVDKHYREFADIENDGLRGEELQTFLESCITAAVPHLWDNAAYYLWHPMLTQGTFFAAAAAAADILIHRQIIWVKPHFIFGRGDYHWRHELAFYGWRKGNRPEFYGERNQDTVWQLSEGGGAIRKEQYHPTQKPVELFAKPMRNHLKPGEIAYEPFAGSGSQYVAGEQLGRLVYGGELEPRYVAVVLQRLADLGLEPRLA